MNEIKRIEKDFNKFAKEQKGITSTALDDYTKQVNGLLVPKAMTPNIIEEREMNAVAMSVFDKLMMDRIIFIGLPIDDMVANVVNAQLLYLDSIDSKKDIQMYINSPGGGVYSGLSMVDLMNYVAPKIATVVTGIAASMAFVLASNGEKGKRFALKHSRLMQHQPMGGVAPGTQATDMEITVKEINKLKKELYEIISKNTGQEYDKIEKDCNRDFWMTSKEAKDYGVIDGIILKRK